MPQTCFPITRPPDGFPLNTKQLQWLSFHREYNGAEAAGAIFKFGGRMYAAPEKFIPWMATQPRISPPVVRNKPANIQRALLDQAGAKAPTTDAAKQPRKPSPPLIRNRRVAKQQRAVA
jgi:hypothetical protein